jgi:pyrimidine-specific ribonucleoside hydrolase
MRRFFISVVLVFFTGILTAQPLPVRLNHSVIIDTDCAIDDMRAISLLLSNPEVSIKAILISDGSLPPGKGAVKAGSLLHEFRRNDIPVAAGVVLKGINPPWREFNDKISWGREVLPAIASKNAVTVLTEELKGSNERIILVCLGPLTNIGQSISRDPGLVSQIERVVWYNESVKPLQGFNYECDEENAGVVFRSGVRIDVISNLDYVDALFDQSFLKLAGESKTDLGSALYQVHSQDAVMEKLNQNHFRLTDDLVSIYLLNPELFSINTNTDKLNVRYNTGYDAGGVKEALGDMIKGVYVSERNVVFNRFPAQREMFNYDVRPIMDSAIARYGPEEWKAAVMTDEFHGHLGVFSIVGAKMGIRAREIFGVGPDELRVTTYAGARPPYSCLTDGIQVSTGATLGMGTISLAADSVVKPSAVFSHKGRSVRITLKKEFLDKVDADINEGILKFGLMDDGYWKLIRENALNYWLDWDRNKIFDVEEVSETH